MKKWQKNRWICALAFISMTKISCLYGQILSDHEIQIQDQVIGQQQQAIDFLEQLVNVNSGTMNFAGVKRVGDLLAGELQQLNFETRWVPLTAMGRAGFLFALHDSPEDSDSGKRVLLLGHLDTVFDQNSRFQKFRRDDDIAYGPGVQDMKGGLTVMLYALKALQEAGDLDDANIIVILTGDEENSGSLFEKSRAPLINAAKNSDYALSFEGASYLNEAVIALRGISYWDLHTSAAGGHSSQIFSPEFGNGAILEMVHILGMFEQQARNEQGLTFNPGIVVGGFGGWLDPGTNSASTHGKRNLIAKDASAEGEIRYLSEAQCEYMQKKMADIVADTSPQTSAEIVFSNCKPTMMATRENQMLLTQLSDVNEALGYGPVHQRNPISTGATDISFVAALLPSIEGLGAVGQGAHSVNEQIHISDLSVATQRAAIFIDRLISNS